MSCGKEDQQKLTTSKYLGANATSRGQYTNLASSNEALMRAYSLATPSKAKDTSATTREPKR